MSQQRVLILLVLGVILVNYVNYVKKDTHDLFRKISLLNQKIEKEKRLNHSHIKDSTLKVEALDYFFGKSATYSESMGQVQEIITQSAKDTCDLKYIKWSQVPISQKWYQKLQFNISVECQPSKMLLFIDKLRNSHKLILLRDLTIVPVKRQDHIRMTTKLVAYKVSDENI